MAPETNPNPANPQIGQLSPDGFYAWTEKGWQPRQFASGRLPTDAQARGMTSVHVSPGQAFKIGFFGIMGAWTASILPLLLVLLAFGSCAALHGASSP